jgi:hypothetical protein
LESRSDDLPDIGARRSSFEGCGERHDIAFGLERLELQAGNVLCG